MTDQAAPMPERRRDRQRRETLDELRRASLAEVRDRGAVGLSLRAVARRMGMSPAGLYRYVESREELLTWLIADGYHDLADHLLAALGEVASPDPDRQPRPLEVPMRTTPQDDVADRLRAVALAYRAWSVAHPNEFGLLFGDPIPGYVAPEGGPTVEAMNRVGLALAQPLLEAWHQGRLRLDPALEDPQLARAMAPMQQVADAPPSVASASPSVAAPPPSAGGALPPAAFARLLLSWGRLHGQVSLEVFGHHAWLFPDGCEALYRADIEATLADLGVVTDRKPAGRSRTGEEKADRDRAER